MWRCGHLTAPEIQNFKNILEEEDDYKIEVNMPGYTSCFLDKSRAMSFAWENASTSHQKVVVNIKIKNEYGAYFLDAGAYDHEQEVLLGNRSCYYVESVEEIKEN